MITNLSLTYGKTTDTISHPNNLITEISNMSVRLHDELMATFLEFGRLMRRKMSCCFKEVNVMQIHAIALLEEHPGMTMKELATRLHVTAPSATAFVQTLVEDGVVERVQDPANRKLVRLKATEAGHALVQEKMAEKNAFMVELLGSLPEEEQRAFLRIMKSIITANSPSHTH